jgi:uncharacterized membrane protein YhaH (DUF805 family)
VGQRRDRGEQLTGRLSRLRRWLVALAVVAVALGAASVVAALVLTRLGGRSTGITTITTMTTSP